MKKYNLYVFFILIFAQKLWCYQANWFDGAASNEDVIELLRQGVPVDIRNYKGYTGLIKAALDGNIERVKIFLKAGADIHARDYLNNTALLLATYSGDYSNAGDHYDNITVVQYLIEKFANTRAKNNLGHSALKYALFMDDIDQRRNVAVNLLKFGADINVQDAQGYSVLHLSVEKKDRPWIVVLTDLFGPLLDLELRNNVGDTPHMYAFKLGFTDEADLLLPENKLKFIDILLKRKPLEHNDFGIYPIHIAAMLDDPAIMSKMIAKDIAILNVKMQDRYGHTPLDTAVLHGKLGALTVLLDNRAHRLEKDNGGNLPLHLMVNMPVQQKRFQVADMLLHVEQADQLNAQNKKGNTPIHMAVIKRDVDLLHYFLRYKQYINPEIRNNNRKTFADLARDLGDGRVIQVVDTLIN